MNIIIYLSDIQRGMYAQIELTRLFNHAGSDAGAYLSPEQVPWSACGHLTAACTMSLLHTRCLCSVGYTISLQHSLSPCCIRPLPVALHQFFSRTLRARLDCRLYQQRSAADNVRSESMKMCICESFLDYLPSFIWSESTRVKREAATAVAVGIGWCSWSGYLLAGLLIESGFASHADLRQRFIFQHALLCQNFIYFKWLWIQQTQLKTVKHS